MFDPFNVAILIRVFTLLILINVGLSFPVKEKQLTVYNPQITYPKRGMIWRAGTTQEVTWETDGIPYHLRNTRGRILLGHDGNGSENLNVGHPLASDFPLCAGHINITMPKWIKPRNDYFVVLLGDSGNTSQRFKVTKN